MNLDEIKKKVTEMKTKYGRLSSNYYLGAISGDEIDDFYENDKALVFGVKEPNKHKYYYYFADETAVKELLCKVPSGGVIEIVSRENEDDFGVTLNEADWDFYARYVRLTMWWNTNPYQYPEQGRRKILYDMYNPERGEIASESDVEELYTIASETFDSVCDDVFTLEQWKEIVGRKNCIVYRENDEIVALYVWRIDGKKLYSNMAINRGPANLLYDLERRIFEQCWDDGIRISYAWFNQKNDKALKRGNRSTDMLIDRKELMYNLIYVKM